MKLKLIINFLLFIPWFTAFTRAADVLFIDVASSSSGVMQKQLELVCRFYGLTVEPVFLESGKNIPRLFKAHRSSEILAIVMTANAFSSPEGQKILSTHGNARNKKIPMLIAGLTSESAVHILRIWPKGNIIRCLDSEQVPTQGVYRVADSPAIARELAGQDIAFAGGARYYFDLAKTPGAQWLLAIKKERADRCWPIFVRDQIAGNDVFFLAATPTPDSNYASAWQFDRKRFFEVVPLILFLRYAGGERCWHSNDDYANFTIDDPWLTEPYGYLSYQGLLEEMEKENFHTTIAFIPWNFDRTAPAVAALFRTHPDRFSVCLHGNNHDHREFYKYTTAWADPVAAKSLHLQELNIQQALARMEKFRSLTGLDYDKVMIFPHGIAPEKTLGLLKKYNFLATVNLNHIPLDSREPDDHLFPLRIVTLRFENFASLKRYMPSARAESEIAIDLFLDNPVLFFTHQDFFENGIASFNRTAKTVNSIQPRIVWQSLGYITQHLYLKRLTSEGNYEILSFSGNFTLENSQPRDLIYSVRKEETFAIPLRRLTVNGQPYAYTSSENAILFTLSVPAGQSRHIVIEYENALELDKIDIAKHDKRINSLRRFSDFRDMILSQNAIGQKLIHFYYRTNLYKLGLMRIAISFCVLIIAANCGWMLLKRYANIQRGI